MGKRFQIDADIAVRIMVDAITSEEALQKSEQFFAVLEEEYSDIFSALIELHSDVISGYRFLWTGTEVFPKRTRGRLTKDRLHEKLQTKGLRVHEESDSSPAQDSAS